MWLGSAIQSLGLLLLLGQVLSQLVQEIKGVEIVTPFNSVRSIHVHVHTSVQSDTHNTQTVWYQRVGEVSIFAYTPLTTHE